MANIATTTSVILLVAIHISSSAPVVNSRTCVSANLTHAEQVAGGMEILTKLGNRLSHAVNDFQNVSSSTYTNAMTVISHRETLHIVIIYEALLIVFDIVRPLNV